MKNLHFVWIVLVLLQATAGLAQENMRISGHIEEKGTGARLPFALLSLASANLGTVSNETGDFMLTIPAVFSEDTLMVSFLGFRTEKIALQGLPAGDLVVRMEKSEFQLAEVEIVSYSAEEVIRRVVERIPVNYGTDSLLLTAFVRSRKYTGGRLAEFAEAVIEDLKCGYSLCTPKEEARRRKESNLPGLIRGRASSDTLLVNSMGEVGRNAGCLGCNFVHDFVEFYHQTVLDESLFRYYNFRMEEVVGPEGKLYHIYYDQLKGAKKRLWKGEMWVNASDFALLKITQRPSFEAFDQYEKEKGKKSYFIDGTGGWIQEMPMLDQTVTYVRRAGVYSLSTIRVENWLTFTHPVSGRTRKMGHRNEVVVTDVTREKERISNFSGDRYLGAGQRWDQVVGNLDPEFWSGFNYLPVEAKLEEAVEGMR